MAGKHRKPSNTRRNVARTVLGLGVVSTGFTAIQVPASASVGDDLEIIAQCESDNRNINNSTYPRSSASGYFQIIDGTWKANGGTEFASRALHATREEQKVVAARIAQRRGSYADWNPSKHCWGGKVGKPSGSVSAPRHSADRVAPQSDAPRHGKGPNAQAAANAPIGKRGTYVCGPDKYLYELCDAGDEGQVTPYPVRPQDRL
jgi:hypothetical protein